MKKRLKRAVHYTPALPFFILVIFFLLLPLLNMIINSFKDPVTGSATIKNFITVFTKPIYYISIFNSISMASAGTIAGIIISFFTALAITSIGSKAHRRFMPILNMTQNFAGFPLAFAFMLMFGRSGFIRLMLKELGCTFIDNYNLYSSKGLIPAFIWFAIPLGTLLLIPGFESIHKEWKESAALLGANSFQFWYKVGIPNLAPALLGTISILFADSITTYTTVYMIIGSNSATLPIKISMMFAGDAKQQVELGSALSITMIVVILIVMFITNVFKRRLETRGAKK